VTNRTYLIKSQRSSISIGDDFVFTNDDCFNPLSRNLRGCLRTHYPGSKITIGNNVGISSACIWAKESITIGNNVKIGGDCIILDLQGLPAAIESGGIDFVTTEPEPIIDLAPIVTPFKTIQLHYTVRFHTFIELKCLSIK